MKHTLTYTAELAGVVARLAAELAAGAVTEGTLSEAENVLRALYQSDYVMGGGYTGFIPRELGWLDEDGRPCRELEVFDATATRGLCSLTNSSQDVEGLVSRLLPNLLQLLCLMLGQKIHGSANA